MSRDHVPTSSLAGTVHAGLTRMGSPTGGRVRAWTRWLALPGALLSLAACVACVACADGVEVRTVVSPSAAFGKYRTFSIGVPESAPRGYSPSPWPTVTRSFLGAMIQTGLGARGYAPVADHGDLVVRFGSGRKVVAVHETTPPEGDQSELESPHFDYPEVDGALMLDAFDGTTGARVWHGASRAVIDPDRLNRRVLQRAVSAMLASFPAGPGAPDHGGP